MKKECIIYVAVNVSDPDGKRVYVGMTERQLLVRKYHHEYAAKRGSKLHFHRAINKYGGNFVWLVIGRAPDFFSGLDLERKYIALYKSLGFDLYNHTDGGGGVKGHKMTAESREKMAEKKRGKPNHWSGGRMPLEIRNKISLKNKGIKRPLNEENRAKMVARAIEMGNANGKPLKCNLDGRIFRSAAAAGKYYGIGGRYIAWCCCYGKSKFGLTFSRIPKEEYPI